MARRHYAGTGATGVLIGLALVWAETHHPEWIQASVAAYFGFWTNTVTPWLVDHLM